MKRSVMSLIKSKTVLWSAIISIASTGIIALLDCLLPSGKTSIPEYGWGFYFFLAVIVFISLLWAQSRTEESVNYKSKFIGNIAFSCLLLLLAIDHYQAHETVRDWVLAGIFTLAIPMEIRATIESYKKWKVHAKEHSGKDAE